MISNHLPSLTSGNSAAAQADYANAASSLFLSPRITSAPLNVGVAGGVGSVQAGRLSPHGMAARNRAASVSGGVTGSSSVSNGNRNSNSNSNSNSNRNDVNHSPHHRNNIPAPRQSSDKGDDDNVSDDDVDDDANDDDASSAIIYRATHASFRKSSTSLAPVPVPVPVHSARQRVNSNVSLLSASASASASSPAASRAVSPSPAAPSPRMPASASFTGSIAAGGTPTGTTTTGTSSLDLPPSLQEAYHSLVASCEDGFVVIGYASPAQTATTATATSPSLSASSASVSSSSPRLPSSPSTPAAKPFRLEVAAQALTDDPVHGARQHLAKGQVQWCLIKRDEKVMYVQVFDGDVSGVRRARALVHGRSLANVFPKLAANTTVMSHSSLCQDLVDAKLATKRAAAAASARHEASASAAAAVAATTTTAADTAADTLTATPASPPLPPEPLSPPPPPVPSKDGFSIMQAMQDSALNTSHRAAAEEQEILKHPGDENPRNSHRYTFGQQFLAPGPLPPVKATNDLQDLQEQWSMSNGTSIRDSLGTMSFTHEGPPNSASPHASPSWSTTFPATVQASPSKSGDGKHDIALQQQQQQQQHSIESSSQSPDKSTESAKLPDSPILGASDPGGWKRDSDAPSSVPSTVPSSCLSASASGSAPGTSSASAGFSRLSTAPSSTSAGTTGLGVGTVDMTAAAPSTRSSTYTGFDMVVDRYLDHPIDKPLPPLKESGESSYYDRRGEGATTLASTRGSIVDSELEAVLQQHTGRSTPADFDKFPEFLAASRNAAAARNTPPSPQDEEERRRLEEEREEFLRFQEAERRRIKELESQERKRKEQQAMKKDEAKREAVMRKLKAEQKKGAQQAAIAPPPSDPLPPAPTAPSSVRSRGSRSVPRSPKGSAATQPQHPTQTQHQHQHQHATSTSTSHAPVVQPRTDRPTRKDSSAGWTVSTSGETATSTQPAPSGSGTQVLRSSVSSFGGRTFGRPERGPQRFDSLDSQRHEKASQRLNSIDSQRGGKSATIDSEFASMRGAPTASDRHTGRPSTSRPSTSPSTMSRDTLTLKAATGSASVSASVGQSKASHQRDRSSGSDMKHAGHAPAPAPAATMVAHGHEHPAPPSPTHSRHTSASSASSPLPAQALLESRRERRALQEQGFEGSSWISRMAAKKTAPRDMDDDEFDDIRARPKFPHPRQHSGSSAKAHAAGQMDSEGPAPAVPEKPAPQQQQQQQQPQASPRPPLLNWSPVQVLFQKELPVPPPITPDAKKTEFGASALQFTPAPAPLTSLPPNATLAERERLAEDARRRALAAEQAALEQIRVARDLQKKLEFELSEVMRRDRERMEAEGAARAKWAREQASRNLLDAFERSKLETEERARRLRVETQQREEQRRADEVRFERERAQAQEREAIEEARRRKRNVELREERLQAEVEALRLQEAGAAERRRRIEGQREELKAQLRKQARELGGAADADAVAAPKALLSGWAQLQVGDSPHWRRRFFELHRDALVFFKDASDKAAAHPTDRFELAALRAQGSAKVVEDAFEVCQMPHSCVIEFVRSPSASEGAGEGQGQGQDATLCPIMLALENGEAKELFVAGFELVLEEWRRDQGEAGAEPTESAEAQSLTQELEQKEAAAAAQAGANSGSESVGGYDLDLDFDGEGEDVRAALSLSHLTPTPAEAEEEAESSSTPTPTPTPTPTVHAPRPVAASS